MKQGRSGFFNHTLLDTTSITSVNIFIGLLSGKKVKRKKENEKEVEVKTSWIGIEYEFILQMQMCSHAIYQNTPTDQSALLRQ